MYSCDIHIIYLKNRSNIAASILMNGGVLEDVKNASENDYIGSADTELAKYLDSVDGRLQRLSNHLQELAAISIDSEWLKTMIDLLDKGVGLVKVLMENIGGVPLAIGAGIGSMLKINGIDILDIGKSIASDLSNTNISGTISETYIPEGLEDRVRTAREHRSRRETLGDLTKYLGDSFNDDESMMSGITTLYGDFENLTEAEKRALEPFMEDLKKDALNIGDFVTQISDTTGEDVADKWGDVIDGISEDMTDQIGSATSEVASNFIKLAGKFKSFGKAIVSTLVNAIVSIGVTFLVAKLVEVAANKFDEISHHSENVIKAGEEAREEINKITKDIEESNKSIKDIAISVNIDTDNNKSMNKILSEISQKYVELKNGVNEFTNANESLTTDDYQKYLDISNELAKQYPTLVKGYDSQGNAVLKLSGNLNECSEQIQNLYSMSLEFANVEIGQQLNTAIDGVIEKVSTLQEKLDDLHLDEVDKHIQNSEEMFNRDTFEMAEGMNERIVVRNANKDTRYLLEQVISDQDIVGEDAYLGIDGVELRPQSDGTAAYTFDIGGYSELDEETKRKIYEKFMELAGYDILQSIDEMGKEKESNQAEGSKYEAQIIDEYARITKDIGKYVKNSSIFSGLSEDIQSALLQNFKFDEKSAEIYEKEYEQNFENFIYGELITKVQDLSDNIKDQNTISDILTGTLFNSDQSLESLRENIRGQFAEIFGEENADSAMDMFGLTDKLIDLGRRRTDISRELQKNIKMDRNQVQTLLYGLSPEEIDKAEVLLKQKTYKSLADFYKDLAKEQQKISKDGTFSQILSDEQVSKETEVFEKSLTAITTGIKEMTEGNLNIKTLIEGTNGALDQSDYTDIVSLQKAAGDQLGKWISLLYKQADAVELSSKEMDKLNDYVLSLIDTYSKDINIEQSDIYKLLFLNIEANDAISAEQRANFVNSIMSQISGYFDDEDNMPIVYAAIEAMPDDAEWTVKDLIDKINEMKASIQVYADVTEFQEQMASIEHRIKEAQNAGQEASDRREYDNKQGIYANDEYYIDTEISSKEAEIASLRQQIDDYKTGKNTNSYEYRADNGGFKDDADRLKTIRDQREAIQGLEAQIRQLESGVLDLGLEKLKVPLTLIDQGTLKDLQTEYDQELLPSLKEYGDKAKVPANVFDGLISNLSGRIAENQNKINILDALIADPANAAYKDSLNELKTQIEGTVEGLTDELDGYVEKSQFGNQIIEISNIDAKKGLLQAIQQASGLDMTEDDYAALNELNEEKLKQIDDILTTANNEMNDLLQDEFGNLIDPEQLEGENAAKFAELTETFRTYATEQANTLREINENNKNMHLLPVAQLEADLQRMEEHTSTIKARIDDLGSKGMKVSDAEYQSYIAGLQGEQTQHQALARRYFDLYRSTPQGDSSRNDYYSKYVSHRNAATTSGQSIQQTLDKIDSKSIEGLEVAMSLLNAESEELNYNLENALRPLTQGDYQSALDNVSAKIENVSKQQQYWNSELDKYIEQAGGIDKIDKTSETYKNIQNGLDNCASSMRELTSRHQELSKAMLDLPFENINKRLQEYQDNLQTLNLAVELKIAQGGKKEDSDYTAQQKEMQKSINDSQEGMQLAVDEAYKMLNDYGIKNPLINVESLLSMTGTQIGETLTREFKNVKIAPKELENIPKSIADSVSTFTDYVHLNPDDVAKSMGVDLSNVGDVNRIVTIGDTWKSFNTQYMTSSKDLANSQHEQAEQQLEDQRQVIASQNVILGQLEEMNQTTIDHGGYLSDDQISTISDQYDAQIENIMNLRDSIHAQMMKNLGNPEFYKTLHDEFVSLKSDIDTINEKKLKLQTTDTEQNLERLASDMNALTQKYNALNGSIGKSARSDTEIYTDMISVAQGQYANKMAEAAQKDSLALFYQAFDTEAGNKLFDEYSQGAEEARQAALDYIATVEELRQAILALPETKIQMTMQRNNAEISAERGKIQQKSSSNNGVLQSSNYTHLLSLDSDNINKQQALLNLKQDNLNQINEEIRMARKTGDEVTDEMIANQIQAQTELYEAQSNLYSAMEQLAQDQKAANDAIMSDYRETTRTTNLIKSGIDNQKIVNEANGVKRNAFDVGVDIAITDQSIKDAQDKLDDLKIGDYKGDTAQADYERDKAELEGIIAQGQAQRAKYVQEEDFLGVNKLEENLGEYEEAYATMQKIREQNASKGIEMSEDEYDSFQKNISSRKTGLKLIQKEYETLYEKYEGTELGDQIDDALDQIEQKLIDLDSQEYNINLEYNGLPEKHLQADLQALQREAEKLQKALDSVGSISSKKGILSGLIKSNDAQVTNLRLQISDYKAKMEGIKQDYLTDPELADDAYIYNDRWKELSGYVADATQQIDGLTAATAEYYTMLQNLPMEQINRDLQLTDSRQGVEDAKIAQKRANDEVVNQSDYNESVRLAKTERTLRKNAYDRALEAQENAQRDFDEAGTPENIKLLNDAKIAVLEAEAAYYQADIELTNVRKEQSDAALNEYRTHIQELDARKAELEASQSLTTSQGQRLSRQDIQNARALAAEYVAETNNAIAEFDKEHEGETLTPELQRQRSDLVATRDQYASQVAGSLKQLVEYDSIELLDTLDEDTDAVKEASSEIDELTRKGQSIPDATFTVKIEGLEQQKSTLEQLSTFYSGLAAMFADSHPEWAEAWESLSEQYAEQAEQAQADIDATNEQSLQQQLDQIDYTITGIQNRSKDTQKLLSDDSVAKTPELYRQAIKEAGEEQTQLVEKMKLTRQEMDGLNFNDPKYQTLSATLEGLEDRFDELTQSTEDWAEEINNLPLKSAINSFNEFKKSIDQKDSDKDAMANMFGYTLTGNDLQKRAENYGKLASEAYDIAQSYARKLSQPFAQNNSEQYQSDFAEYESWMDTAHNYEFIEQNEALIESAKAPITELQNSMKDIQNEAQGVQDDINKLVEAGYTGTEEQYKKLNELNQQQIDNIGKQKAEYETFRQFMIDLIPDDVNIEGNPIFQQIDEAILQLDQDYNNLTRSMLENNLMLNGGTELKGLQDALAKLELVNTRINNTISEDQAKGLTSYAQTYQDMADNLAAQIDNLVESNNLLEKQQSTVGLTKAKFDELEASIQSNRNTISNLTQSLDEFNKKIRDYSENMAKTLGESISTALSESLSGTGLSSNTMDSLLAQFRQLEELGNFDLSGVFERTAQGVKLNTNAMKDLVKIQKDAFSNKVANIITQQNALFAKQTTAVSQNGRTIQAVDAETLASHNQKMDALRDEVTQYAAIMDSIEKSLDTYSAWQSAQQTENAGDRYNNIVGSLRDVELSFQRGETNTDDIRKFTQMASARGLDTNEEFNRIYEYLTTFFTSNSDGINAFVQKLDEFGYSPDQIIDVNELSEKFGLSNTIIEALIGKANDRGAGIQVVSDALDAESQIIESSEKLIGLRQKLAETDKNDLISRQEINKQISEEEARLDTLYAKRDELSMPQALSEEDYNNQVELIKSLKEEYDKAFSLGQTEYANSLYGSIKEGMSKIFADFDGNIENLHFNDYETYLTAFDETIQKITDSIPDFDKAVQYVQEYQSGFSKLKEIAPDIDFSFLNNITDQTETGKIQEFIGQLRNIQINVDEDPEAKQSLDELLTIANNELGLHAILDFRATNNQEATLESLAALSDDEILSIIGEVDIEGTDAQTLLEFIRNKAGELPVSIRLDTATIETFKTMLEQVSGKKIELDLEPSEQSENEITNFADYVENYDYSNIDVQADSNYLVNSIDDVLENKIFKINVLADSVGNIMSGQARATGGAIGADGPALVNELGHGSEGLIRDGKLTEIPGGMHVQNFKKGDVILNHRQMETLKKTGKASGKGKIVGGDSAFAHGTMPAFAGGGTFLGNVRSNTGRIYENTVLQQNKLSKQTFDLFAKKIEHLDNSIEGLTSILDEYTDIEEKTRIYEEQNSLLRDQLDNYEKQEKHYKTRASSLAVRYEYQDENGDDRFLNLDEEAKKLGFKGGIRDFYTGDAKIKDIQSAGGSQVFINGVQDYLDLMGQADQASKSLSNVYDRMIDVRKQLDELPMEKLSRNLDNINNAAERFNAIAEVAKNGAISMGNMYDNLKKLFGDNVDKIYDPNQNRLEALNQGVDNNIQSKRDIYDQHVEASKANAQNIKSTKSEIDKQSNELKDLQNKALALDGVSEDIREKIENGDVITQKELDEYSGDAKYILEEYSFIARYIKKLQNELNSLEKKNKDEVTATIQAASDLSIAEAQRISEYLANTSAIYGEHEEYLQSSLSKNQAMVSRLSNYGSFTKNADAINSYLGTNYGVLMNQIQNKQAELAQQEEYIAGVEEGSAEWEKYQITLNNTRTELINLQSELDSTSKELLDMPIKVTQDRLDELSRKTSGIATALSSGVTSSVSTMNAYNRLASSLGGPNTLAQLGISSGLTGYQATNELLNKEVEIAQQEASIAVDGHNKAMENLNEKIAALAVAVTPEQIAEATKAVDEATKKVEETGNLADQKQMTAAVLEVEKYEKQIKNVDAYYQNIVSHIDTMISQLKVAQQYMEIGNGYSVNGANIEAGIIQQIGQVQQQQAALAQDVVQMEAILAQGVASGDIVIGDEKWLALDTSINQVRNSMYNLQLTQLQLQEEMANIPNKVVQAKLKDIEDAYNSVTSAMSANITSSMTSLKFYRQLAQAIGMDVFGNMNSSLEYEYQDTLNVSDRNRLREEADVAIQGYKDAEARYWAGGTEEQIRLNKQAMEEAKSVMNQKLMELANKEAAIYSDHIKNVESYYNNINNYLNSIIEGYKIQNDLLKDSDGIINDMASAMDNYHKMEAKTAEEAEQLRRSIDEMEATLNGGIVFGDIVAGDQLYNQLSTSIQEAKNKLNQLKLTQKEYLEELMKLPLEQAEKKIEKLEKRFTALNSAMSHNIADSASTRAMLNSMIEQFDWANYGMQKPFTYNMDLNTYRQQNIQGEQQLQEEEEILKIRNETLEIAMKNASNVFATSEEMDAAAEALTEAQEKYLDQLAKVAEMRVQLIVDKLKNIENYYNNAFSYLDSVISLHSATRNFYTEHYGYLSTGVYDIVGSNVDEEVKLINQKKEMAEAAVRKMEDELNRGIMNGTIIEGDEKWQEMQTDINKFKQQIIQFRDEQVKTFTELLDVPMKRFQQVADNISKLVSDTDKRHSLLRSTTAASVLNTISQNGGQQYGLSGNYQSNRTIDALGNQVRMLIDSTKYQNLMIKYAESAIKDAELNLQKLQSSGAGSALITEAIKKVSEAQENYRNAVYDAVQSSLDEITGTLTDIRNLTETMNRYTESLISKTSAQINNIVNYLGYESNRNTIATGQKDMASYYATEQNALKESALLQKTFIEEQLKAGNIQKNDLIYYEMQTELNNTEQQIEETRAKYFDMIKEMLSLPSNIISERIQNITDSYSGLTTAISSGVLAMSGSQRSFAQMNDMLANIPGSHFSRSSNNYITGGTNVHTPEIGAPTFVWQNKAAVDDLNRQKQETTELTLSALAAQDLYNGLIKSGTATQEEIKIAENLMNDAINKAEEGISNLSKMQSELVENMVNNIEEYYSRLNGYISAINNNIKSIIDYTTKTSGYRKNIGSIWDGYVNSIDNTRTQMTGLVKEIRDVQGQINEGLGKSFNKNDDEYIKLATNLRNLQGELIDTTSNLYDLQEAFYNLPNDVAAEQIDNLTKKYINLTSAMSANSTETTATQRALKNLANEYSNLINANQFNFALGETFVGQNATLGLDLQKDKEELDILADALKETQISLDTLKMRATSDTPLELQPAELDLPGSDEITEEIEDEVSGASIDFELSLDDGIAEIAEAEEELTLIKDEIGNTGKLIDGLEESFDGFNETIADFDGTPIEVVTGTVENLGVSYGVTQEEMYAAEKARDTAQQNFTEKMAQYSAKMVQYVKQSVQNIGTYYNSLISYQDAINNKYQSMMSVLEQVGRRMDSHGNLINNVARITEIYEGQIDALTKKQELLAQSIVEQRAEMDRHKETVGEDTEEYREMEASLMSLEAQFNDVTVSIDKLEDAMRQQLYFKPIEEAIVNLQTLRGNLQAINGLIEDEAKLTEQGDYTNVGLLSMALNVESYQASLAELEKAEEEYNTMHERWLEDDSYSDEQYIADRQSAIARIQSAMQGANTGRQAILTGIKNRYRTEIDYIKKLIQAQSDELAKQKELDDYDRNLKDKTNAVKRIEMQLMALQDLNDAESRAQRARIEEQLKNSQDDLDNTVKDHVVQLRQEGLSELSTKLDEVFDKFVKELAVDTDRMMQVVNDMNGNIDLNLDRVNTSMNEYLGLYSKDLTTEMATGTSAVVTKISDAYAADIQSTEEMEAAKAAKLEIYENAKQQAMANHEEAQRLREEAMKNLFESYKDQEKTSDDIIASDLDMLINVNTDINTNLLNLDAHVIQALTSNEKNIVSIIGDSAAALNLAIANYADDNNPLHQTIKGILDGIATSNSKLDNFNESFFTGTAVNLSERVTGIHDLIQQYIKTTTETETSSGTSTSTGSGSGGSSGSSNEPKKYTYNSGGSHSDNINGLTTSFARQNIVAFSKLPEGEYQFQGNSITGENNKQYVMIRNVRSNDRSALDLVGKYIPLSTLQSAIGFKEGQDTTYDSSLKKIISTSPAKPVNNTSSGEQLLIEEPWASGVVDSKQGGNAGNTIPSGSKTGRAVPIEEELLIEEDSQVPKGSKTGRAIPLQVDNEVSTILDTASNIISNQRSGLTSNSSGIQSLASKMDSRVLQAFEDLGFKYVIDENFKQGEGYFNAKRQTITLTKAGEDIYHELGHFLGFITGNSDLSSRFKNIYSQEKDSFNGTYRGYARSNISEFFAECVREYTLHNKDLKNWCPQAYSYITEMLEKVTPEQIKKVRNAYQKIWAAYGSTPKYAKGTFNAKKGIGQVFENGPEIITTSKGTFIPFQGGEGVVPAKQTETLMNLAKAFNNGSLKLQMPDMSNYQLPSANTQVNTSNSIHIESLITINGNANQDTVDEIKQIAQQLVSNKQFQENVTQFVSKRQASDSRMAGKRIGIK